MSQHDLGKCVVNALEQYFRDLDGNKLNVFCVGQ